jgi:mono/diheme cytochrome c family protein
MRFLVAGCVSVLLVNNIVAQPISRADLKPGLVFQLGASERVEPGVALYAAKPSEGRATWSGTINILQPGKYRFDAGVVGVAKVMVADKVVFAANTNAAGLVKGAEVELPAGIQVFTATLERTNPELLQLELQWSGPGFRPEPVPYFFFGHLPKQRMAGHLEQVAKTHGRFLFEEQGCVKCHQSDAKFTDRRGPNLTRIGERTNPGWLDAWLQDPHALRPNTTMPKMFTTDATGHAERYAMVAYLSDMGTPTRSKAPSMSEATKSIANGQKLFLTTGCATCHGDKVTTPAVAKKKEDDEDDKPQLLPEDSFYALGTSGPQGQYVLGNVGSKFTPESLAKYLANPLATNPHGRMPNLNLTNDETRDLGRYLARFTDDKLTTTMPKEPTEKPGDFANVKSLAEWKAVGKKLFVSKGCVNCHTVDGVEPKAFGPKLAALSAKPTAGCLSATPDVTKTPVYKLDAKQKSALAGFLKTSEAQPPLHYEAKAAIKRFNCLNCHNKDGEGGIGEDLAAKMKAVESAENADDVAPPRLTQVGHKLRSSWTRKVLVEGARARPWMNLRMPQYGADNVGHLVEGLPHLEGTSPDDTLGQVPVTSDKIAIGRTLAGKNGLGCITCHDISGITGGGTRGPDLARTHERVRLDWFNRWMHQPQRLAPGTKMPSNYLDGKSVLGTILNGDGDAQIEAMWSYFSLGPGLPLPSGMEPPKGLIVSATDKPLLLRTFMPDNAGTRPIAIAYPGGINVVFDAATCRVSYAWAGNFLDTNPVWNGRGGNPAKLLGPKFWSGPAGFPWAIGDEKPDFAKQFDDPKFGHQLTNDSYAQGPRYVHFTGYGTSADGTPNFDYELRNPSDQPTLRITEAVSALPVITAPGFRRVYTISSEKSVWLYVGESKKPITLPADGVRVLLSPEGNDKTTVHDLVSAPKDAKWVEVKSGNSTMLLLHLPAGEKLSVTLDTWSVPRAEEALIKGLKK